MEEISSKSTMKWNKLAKNGAGLERYLRSMQGQEVLRLLFSQRTGSAGLLVDKKRCKMIIDERCVVCESGAGDNVEHLLVTCRI